MLCITARYSDLKIKTICITCFSKEFFGFIYIICISAFCICIVPCCDSRITMCLDNLALSAEQEFIDGISVNCIVQCLSDTNILQWLISVIQEKTVNQHHCRLYDIVILSSKCRYLIICQILKHINGTALKFHKSGLSICNEFELGMLDAVKFFVPVTIISLHLKILTFCKVRDLERTCTDWIGCLIRIVSLFKDCNRQVVDKL